jgi:aerobic-type carbon monoxide dehydrogenase small subunit (CoxS/CutS family)
MTTGHHREVRRTLRLTVNGEPRTVEAVPVRKTLADLLREDLRLTGTHLGCEHGVCGACTVLVNGRTARACLLLAIQADGAEVVTVEGLAADPAWASLRQAFVVHQALQCGFCTPGILATMVELLRERSQPGVDEVRDALAGHLCRCTGYLPIVEAVRAVVRDEARAWSSGGCSNERA